MGGYERRGGGEPKGEGDEKMRSKEEESAIRWNTNTDKRTFEQGESGMQSVERGRRKVKRTVLRVPRWVEK